MHAILYICVSVTLLAGGNKETYLFIYLLAHFKFWSTVFDSVHFRNRLEARSIPFVFLVSCTKFSSIHHYVRVKLNYDNDDDRDDDYDYRKDSYDKNTSTKYNYDCFGRNNRSHKDYNDHVIKYQYWNDY